jgi:hypothetical protein
LNNQIQPKHAAFFNSSSNTTIGYTSFHSFPGVNGGLTRANGNSLNQRRTHVGEHASSNESSYAPETTTEEGTFAVDNSNDSGSGPLELYIKSNNPLDTGKMVWVQWTASLSASTDGYAETPWAEVQAFGGDGKPFLTESFDLSSAFGIPTHNYASEVTCRPIRAKEIRPAANQKTTNPASRISTTGQPHHRQHFPPQPASGQILLP